MTDKPKEQMQKNGMADRAAARKERITARRSHSFLEAEEWDLEYWQSVGPEERLSALVALRNDLEKCAK